MFKTAGGRFFSNRLLQKQCTKATAAKSFIHQVGVIDVASNSRLQESSNTTWQLEIGIGIYQKPVIFPTNTNSTYKPEASRSIDNSTTLLNSLSSLLSPPLRPTHLHFWQQQLVPSRPHNHSHIKGMVPKYLKLMVPSTG